MNKIKQNKNKNKDLDDEFLLIKPFKISELIHKEL